MKKGYELRQTSLTDDSDMSTGRVYSEDALDAAVNGVGADCTFHYGLHYVEISEYSEGGWYYDIFHVDNPDDSIDGGLCTGSWIDAVIMAVDQLKAY